MSTDIYLNTITNDIDLFNNEMRLATSIQEVSRQKVQIWLSMFKGEWFANVIAGIPYLKNDTNTTQLLGKTSKEVFDFTIQEAVLTREGITSLLQYESTLDKETRTLAISFEASTETGEIVTVEDLTISI